MLRVTAIDRGEIERRRLQAEAFYARHGRPDEDMLADHELFIQGKMERDEYEEYLAWKHAPGVVHEDVDMSKLEQAIFAGGCFWCIQEAFDCVRGVVVTEVGYTGGHLAHPRYEDVHRGEGGHVEAVRVSFDPEIVGYAALLDVYWHQIDPLQRDGQFADIGPAYRSIIFVLDDAQRHLAELSRRRLEQSGRLAGPVVTEIRSAGPFYPAEAEHQHYYRRHAGRYQRYKEMSRRQERLSDIWGRSVDEEE